jgi:hypothetical protein
MPSKVAHSGPGDATAVSKVNIPTDLHQRARAAVRLIERVTGRRYTFAQFVREAVIAQLAVITDYNCGPDSAPLEPGRR